MERFWDVEQDGDVRCPDYRQTMALLAHGPHAELLSGLASGDEVCVTELADRVKLHFDTASVGLRTLQGFGLVTVRREKRFHYYRLGRGFKLTADEKILELVVPNLDGSTVHLVVPRNRVSRPV